MKIKKRKHYCVDCGSPMVEYYLNEFNPSTGERRTTWKCITTPKAKKGWRGWLGITDHTIDCGTVMG